MDLQQVFDKLKNLSRKTENVNAARFNDPVALQTDWTPLKRGGTNFKTHKLLQVNSGRMEFRVSIGAIIFYLIFTLFGLAFLIFFCIPNIEDNNYNFSLVDVWMPLLFSTIFILVGVILFYFGSKPAVFDRGNGIFWKGWKNPDAIINKAELKNLVYLKNIYALQIISEFVRGNKTSYYSYELNLVLKDGSRVNVIDHGNKKAIINDAERLSEFLDKPLWNPLNN